MKILLLVVVVFAAILVAVAWMAHRRRGMQAQRRDVVPALPASGPAAVENAPAPSAPVDVPAPVREAPAPAEDNAASIAPTLAAARGRDNGPSEAADVQDAGADFYAEVVGLLEGELARNPQRDDLRIKLLEVYAATERKLDFVKLATLHLRALPDGRKDRNWQTVLDMGRRLVPNHALFSDAAPSAAPVVATAPEPQKFRRYYESVDADALATLQAELHKAYQGMRQDIKFWKQLRERCNEFAGAPPALMHARKLSGFLGGAQILVRDDSRRPASDVAMVSAVGQVLLAQTLGRWRVVASPAEDGHAVSVARAAQHLGVEATIVVTRSEEAARSDELARLKQADAKIVVVADGPAGPNEGQRAALALALEHGPGTLFISPLSAGPAPYPAIVRELHGLSGLQLKSQVNGLIERLPDGVIVSASDGMPAVGFLQAFLGSPNVKLFCVEAQTGGSRSHRLGREHGWLRASGRVRYSSVADEVANFAARHCLPDLADELQWGSGEVLAETFALARQFTPKQVLVAVLPARQS